MQVNKATQADIHASTTSVTNQPKLEHKPQTPYREQANKQRKAMKTAWVNEDTEEISRRQ